MFDKNCKKVLYVIYKKPLKYNIKNPTFHSSGSAATSYIWKQLPLLTLCYPSLVLLRLRCV